MKVAIIGAGAFGTALGGVISNNGHDISYYDPAFSETNINTALNGAEYVVLAAPSAVVPAILPQLPKDIPLIVATKGLLGERIFEGFHDFMVLSGPGFADDIKNCKPTTLTATDERVIKLFTTDYLSFDYTDDRNGVLLCGALKNIFAILAGYKEFVPDTEEHRTFLQLAADEMKMILQANGGRRDTVDLSCGKKDLEITCYLPSRNYEFGKLLKANPLYRPEKTVEGVTALIGVLRGEIVVPEGAKLMREIMTIGEKWV